MIPLFFLWSPYAFPVDFLWSFDSCSLVLLWFPLWFSDGFSTAVGVLFGKVFQLVLFHVVPMFFSSWCSFDLFMFVSLSSMVIPMVF
jgi:hypothetical protein